MKKLLVIVYYWPPSGGAGVQRWLKFVKYLPQFGWMPTVITTKDGDYPVIDESLFEEVPTEVKVIQTKTPTFGKLFKRLIGKNSEIPYGSLESNSTDSLFKKLSIWIRLNLVIPDARKIWNKFAYEAAREELLTNKYNAVITSGPPHSTHLVGLKLKKKYNIKWIADFRDPWTEIAFMKNIKRWKSTDFIDRLLERKVINNCDILLATAQKIIDDFGNKNNMRLLTNGFDKQDFENVKKRENNIFFKINHFGLLTQGTDLSNIFEVMRKLEKKKINKIQFNFWGNISKDVVSSVKEIGFENKFKFHSYLSHKEMLSELVNSSMLLLVLNNVRKGIIPLKLFEYMGSNTTILGIGDPASEPAVIIEETKSGKMFDYDKVDDIADFIETNYKYWKAGKTFILSKEIKKYSKINQTKQLAEILEKM